MQPDLRSTRSRLTLRYAAFVAGLLVMFAAGVYGEVSRSSQELLRRQAEQLAATAAAELPLLHHESDEARSMPAPQSLEGMAIAGEANGIALPQQRIVWLDDELQLLHSIGSFQPEGATMPPPADRRHVQWLTLSNGVAYWRPVRGREGVNGTTNLHGYVSVAVATTATEGELKRLRHGLLVGALLAALSAFLASQRMVAASLQPIQRQIEQLIRFTADASHELRQPLTAIRALIGSLRHGEELASSSPGVQRGLAQIDQTTARMGKLVDDLLLLTRFDRSIDDQQAMETFPMAELVEDVVDLHQAEAEAAGVSLQSRIEAAGRVHGSPERLRRLLENLLSNALRFSPPGGTVTLGVRRQKGLEQVWVEDEGPGISPSQRTLVFERFWQADPARGGAEHHGLGLSIARAIAMAHGGHLRVEGTRGKGCRMILELPALS